MKLTTTSSFLALAAASTASAQNAPIYLNQSAPFGLKIGNSANASLNGLYLYACHAGAAEEGLCIGGTPTPSDISSTFYYNTTDSDLGSPNEGQGQLVWNLPIQLNGQDHVPQGASLNPFFLGTNVVVPYFGFSDPTLFHFTEDGKLTIQDYYNDANFVAGEYPSSDQTPTVYNNWYVCWTRVGNYYYHALAWVTAGVPHDPTCEKVDVFMAAL